MIKFHLLLSPSLLPLLIKRFLECWRARLHCCNHLKNFKKPRCPGTIPRHCHLISLGCSLKLIKFVEFFKAPGVILMGNQVREPLYRKTFSLLLKIFSLNSEIMEYRVHVKIQFSWHEGRKIPSKEQTLQIQRFSGALSVLHRKAGLSKCLE